MESCDCRQWKYGSNERNHNFLPVSRLPLTCLFESRRGKNAALNSGLSAVSGDLVVLTDDDVLPTPDWLMQLRSAADSQSPLRFLEVRSCRNGHAPPEDWILNWVPQSPTFAILNSEEGPIDPRLVFGPNMAIRADIFQDGYRLR